MSVPIDELRTELTELLNLVRQLNERLPQLRRTATTTRETVLRLSTALYGVLGILRRMGLGEKAEEIISRIQQIIATINMLRLSVWMLYTATGPIGYLAGGVAFAGSFMTLMGSFQA